MSEDSVVEIPYDEHVHETDKACLFAIGDEEVWIPKSQIQDWFPSDNVFSIPEWLAIEKGLV